VLVASGNKITGFDSLPLFCGSEPHRPSSNTWFNAEKKANFSKISVIVTFIGTLCNNNNALREVQKTKAQNKKDNDKITQDYNHL